MVSPQIVCPLKVHAKTAQYKYIDMANIIVYML